MKNLSILALVLAPLFASCVIAAEDKNKYLHLNIEVSANRISQSLLKTTNTVDVVDSQTIEQSGENEIPLALAKQPGIRVQSDGTPGIYTISIRSEQPSRIVLLTDGIRMSDQKSRQGMPLLYNPFNVERVEIIRGASSVLYGSDAQAGIVNVVSKNPSDRKFASDSGLIFNSQGNGFTQMLNASGTIDRFSYVTSFSHTDMGDRYLSDNRRLDNTSYYQSGANAKLMYQLCDYLKIGTSFDYFDINAKTATTTKDPAYDGFKMHIPNWSYKKASIFTQSQNVNEIIGEISSVFYTTSENKEFVQDTGLANYNSRISVNNDESALGGNIKALIQTGKYLNFTSGYDFRQERCDGITGADLSSNPLAKRGRAPLSTRAINTDSRQDSHALYSLFTLFPYERFNLEYGLRWNHYSTKSGDNLTEAVFKRGPLLQNSKEHKSKTNVRIVQSAGALYKLDYRTVLRASYSEGFKIPGISQLFMTSYSGRTIEPNEALKPESSKNYEIGIRFDGEELTVDADIFYSRSKNYIDISRYSIMPEKYRYRNVSKAKSFGAELKLSYNISGFTPYINLTAMRRELSHENLSTYDSGSPTLFGSTGIRFDSQHLLGKYYADLYASFANSYTEDPDLSQNSLIKNDNYTSGYMTLNLSAGSDIYTKDNCCVKIFGSINNIFDKQYRTSVYIEEPGRYFTLGVKASF